MLNFLTFVNPKKSIKPASGAAENKPAKAPTSHPKIEKRLYTTGTYEYKIIPPMTT